MEKELSLLDDEPDDETACARALRTRVAGIARQVALDPDDGIALQDRQWGRLGSSSTWARSWRGSSKPTPRSIAAPSPSSPRPPSLCSSPDTPDRMEAVLAKRLDRVGRQIERLNRDTGIGLETLALFIRYWLVALPTPSEAHYAAGQQARAPGRKGRWW